jgi:glucosamine-6-phosphate deaminase
MKEFSYRPASFIPFQDLKAVERVRRIKKADLTKHPNPEFRIKIVPDADVEFLWIADMFNRIRAAAAANKPVVMIMPNPWPSYAKVAHLINLAKLSCRHLHTFNMDEYADENGNIAPETWRFGFGYAFKKYFWSSIDAKLRPPEKQVHLLSNKTIKDYSTRLADLGGADICYSGPGWSGHLAFIEPDAPEFAGSLAEWKKMGARVCTLGPLTIAQNSLHGSFGASGDLWTVPPKAATIGPADVIGAKNRLDLNAISLGGTFISWQRLTTRLCLHGPVTPRMPTSILQTLPTQVLVADSAAADIEPHWEIGY